MHFETNVETGRLMFYGPDFRAMFHRAADLVDKILRGVPPADLPVTLRKRYELVINQNTATALGIPIPRGVRGRPSRVGRLFEDLARRHQAARKEDGVRGCETQLVAPRLLTAPTSGLRRRAFVALLCSAALAPVVNPYPACAQQQGKVPTIGFLGATTPSIWSAFLPPFQQRLRELGWIDGQNIAIEYRWAEGREDRYAEFADEFVRRKVDVIVTAGTAAAAAVKSATTTIPIVFAAAGDPVGTGLVASLARPGGNVTGLSNQQTDLAGKRLEQLHSVPPVSSG
jgi:ABC-type uncharacterized transport system substrate-binding protein